MKLIFSLLNLTKYFDRGFNLFLNDEKFKKFMLEAENITIEYSSIEFFKLKDLRKEQVGYRFNHIGKSLIGTKKGDWKSSWIAIGYDGLDDPIFVDFDKPNLPVFTSMHGEGEWIETYISISLDNFRTILNDLKKLKQLKETGISETAIATFLEKTKIENKYMDVEYWEIFLNNE